MWSSFVHRQCTALSTRPLQLTYSITRRARGNSHEIFGIHQQQQQQQQQQHDFNPLYCTRKKGFPFFRSSSRRTISQGPSIDENTSFCTSLYMSAMDDDSDEENLKTLTSEWNIGGLKKEVSRLTVRSHKKIGKANQRLQNAQEKVDQLTADPDATLEELENCPNIEELENNLSELQEYLKKLNKLEVLLSEISGKKVVLPEHVAELALELDLNDTPPPPQARGPKKEKGPRKMTSFRLPYRRFYSVNKTEIRVGKQAGDNDELSLSPAHRDGADWWMHASGCPGSHVVIRCRDEALDSEVEQDAAALAARQSKCTGSMIKVSVTRARDIKKPPGAKAGLVQLTGKVKTISVNMKEAQKRLDRLDKTVLVN